MNDGALQTTTALPLTVVYQTLPIASFACGRSERPAGYAQRLKTGVEWHPSAVNGKRRRGSFAAAGRGTPLADK